MQHKQQVSLVRRRTPSPLPPLSRARPHVIRQLSESGGYLLHEFLAAAALPRAGFLVAAARPRAGSSRGRRPEEPTTHRRRQGSPSTSGAFVRCVCFEEIASCALYWTKSQAIEVPRAFLPAIRATQVV